MNSYSKSNVLSLNLSNNAIEYIQPGALTGLQDLILLWVHHYYFKLIMLQQSKVIPMMLYNLGTI